MSGDHSGGKEPAAYQRVSAEIRRKIEAGEYLPGQRLPSLADLERSFRVGRATSRATYAALIAEGIVEGRERSGFFVPEQILIRDGERWYRFGTGSPFFAEERAAGRVPDLKRHTERVSASPLAAELLGVDLGDELVQTDYVFLSDARPVMLSRSWEPLRLTRGTVIEDPEGGSSKDRGVLDRFALIGIRGTHVFEKPRARTATGIEASELRIKPGAAVLEITRIYCADELRFEAAVIVAGPSYRPSYKLPTRA